MKERLSLKVERQRISILKTLDDALMRRQPRRDDGFAVGDDEVAEFEAARLFRRKRQTNSVKLSHVLLQPLDGAGIIDPRPGAAVDPAIETDGDGRESVSG